MELNPGEPLLQSQERAQLQQQPATPPVTQTRGRNTKGRGKDRERTHRKEPHKDKPRPQQFISVTDVSFYATQGKCTKHAIE